MGKIIAGNGFSIAKKDKSGSFFFGYLHQEQQPQFMSKRKRIYVTFRNYRYRFLYSAGYSI